MARVGDIAKRWRDLHGKDHWNGLLDPLDLDLRRHVLLYGDMAQATYDAFNTENASRHAGMSRYAKANFFERVDLTGPADASPYPYRVTKFVYATTDVKTTAGGSILQCLAMESASSWIGFVAVATDAGKAQLGRRDIVVAWRGTQKVLEWLNNLDFVIVSASSVLADDQLKPQVERGWFSIYTSVDPSSEFNKTSAREQVLSELRRLVEQYKDEEISITTTGHSMGGVLATLSATDIAFNGYNHPQANPDRKSFPVTAIVFACPKVGDAGFKKVFNKTRDVRALRVRNKGDVVPDYPFIGYEAVGEEVAVDIGKSPHLNSNANLFSSRHNLELYLHGVAGTQGSKGGFALAVARDLALVNKSIDGLISAYHIPPSWKVAKNKGMVRGPDGGWKLIDNEDELQS